MLPVDSTIMNKVVFALQYVHDHKHYKVIIISLESSWVEYVFVEGIAPFLVEYPAKKFLWIFF